jgi:hypothetical protein
VKFVSQGASAKCVTGKFNFDEQAFRMALAVLLMRIVKFLAVLNSRLREPGGVGLRPSRRARL